jgi:tRNA-Thr(GGU) m(6)t(6)A37 methyltransferase TsaA
MFDQNGKLTLTPIGYIRSCYKEKFGTPRQSGLVSEAIGVICILPEFQPENSLEGIDGFSHVWVIWGFHQNKSVKFNAKVQPPRLGGEKKGVFSTRSPHRPNPLGLSLVKIIKVDGPNLFVSGLDIIEETPVYDIKPYLPELESIDDAKSGWVEELQTKEGLEFEWSQESQIFLREHTLEITKNNFKFDDFILLIKKTISLDPRPIIYRGFEEKQNSPYVSLHTIKIFQFKINFKFTTKNCVLIYSIESSH